MQTSTTLLKKPLYLWLARIVTLGFILASIGIGVSSLPDVLDKLKNTLLRNVPADGRVLGGIQLGLPFDISVTLIFLFTLIPMVVGAVGALLLYWLRSNDWMALFTAMVLANFGIAASGIHISSNPVIIIFNHSIFFSTFFWILVFPNGKLTPRWSWAYLLLLLPSFVLQSIIDLELLSWARQGDFTSLTHMATLLTYMATLLTYMAMLALFSILYFRYRDTFSAIERQQTKWVITPLIAGLTVIGFTYSFLMYQYEEIAIAQFFYFFARTVCFVSLAVGIFFSILRYRLWDIDIIINRALVYGTLTAIVIGIYVLIVGGLGTAIQGRNNLLVSILATGLVAVLVQPLRDRLQRGVNRMMYGERDDPVTVLSRLGQRLEGTLAPDAVLPSLVETVAQTLKLPYVAIEMTTEDGPDSTSAISHGQLQPDLVRLPLIYQTETIGQLVVSPRAQGEALNPMDRHLLENIAHQAGMAVHAVSLTTDLQRSRQRLVTTREEERRRLRRDLHDGLGPNLASQGLKLAAVKQLLEHDPMSAIPLLEQVMAQNQSTVEEVRHLVYGLRPPALDELGLVAAIRDYVAGMDGKSTLRIEITAPPDGLPLLSAAVEVAAYRIILEALTNVIRHAEARSCMIRFSLDQTESDHFLQIEIQDDGIGLPDQRRAGVGTRSMRERAEELGGTFVIESIKGNGTLVCVKVPFAAV